MAFKRTGVNLPPITFISSPNHSNRTSKVGLIVLHDTEGGYDGAISWFRSKASQVSAHVVLREDGLAATQMVKYDDKAWHCSTFNSESIGLEMAGFSRLGYGVSQLRHAARIVAFFLHKYNLPARHVHPSGVGARGFTFHQDLGVLGGGHTDPGFSKKKTLWFDALVKWEYARGGFRKTWGID